LDFSQLTTIRSSAEGSPVWSMFTRMSSRLGEFFNDAWRELFGRICTLIYLRLLVVVTLFAMCVTYFAEARSSNGTWGSSF